MATEIFEALTRPCVRDVTAYLPGKPIAEVQRELRIKRVVKLASNENALGPSPSAAAEIRRAAADIHLYPEGASPLLRRAVAAHWNVAESQVIVGNGSDEIIRLLCEAFLSPDDVALASQYGFIRFKQQAMLMGAKIVEVPMKDFKHDLDAMARAAGPRVKLAFVASPNNPTGTYNTREEIRRFLEALPAETILILDEAYYDFAAPRKDYPDSIREFAASHPNLLVLRTFSKAYGLAGLRVGYGVGDARLVAWLDRIRMPFNVSLLSQRAAVAALKDSAFVRKSVSLVEKNGAALADELRSLGFGVGDSSANFVFARSPLPGKELFQKLLHAGVIIRPLDEYGLGQYVRISVGTASQNRTLIQALRGLVARSPETVVCGGRS